MDRKKKTTLLVIIGLLTAMVADPVLTVIGYADQTSLLLVVQVIGYGIAIIGGAILLYETFGSSSP